MRGVNAMKNGTQSEYIESVGGKASFETLNAEDLSWLCSMYATSGKISSFIDCTETLIRRFRNSPDAKIHFLVVNGHESMALTYNGFGNNAYVDKTIDEGLALLEEKNMREDWVYGSLIRTVEIELYALKAVTAHKRGDAVAEAKALSFVEQSMPWLNEQNRGLRQKTRKTLSQSYLALEDYEKAAEFAEKLPPDEPTNWDKFEKIADAVTTFGLSLAIDAYGEKKLKEAEKEADLAFDTSLYFMGRADLEARRYEKALEHFKALESYTSISKDFNLHWMYWYDYARIYQGLGNHELMMEMLKKSVDVIESQRMDFNSEMGKMGFARSKQQVYELMVKTLLEAGNTDEAFSYVERAKARALVDLLAGREDINFSDSPEARQYLAQLQQVESRVPMSIKPNPEENIRSLSRVPKERLETNYPELASLISVDTLSRAQAGELLEKDEVLVEYYIAGDDLFAFVLENQQLKVYPLDGKNLAGNIRDYRKKLTALDNGWKKPSMALYRQLIRPFGRRLYNKNLVIVPHGAMHYLPFASLFDGKKFMADKARIRLVPSASVMRYIGKHTQTSAQMMILGNPDLHNPATDLPGAEKEAQAIAKLWSGSDIRLRNQATETALKNGTKNYGMFHFASHGVFDPVNPLDSSLLLAADQQNDGKLTVAEIYGIRLNANLVTLSACETGLGDVVSGDDVVGLNRGFLYAGADTILSSLWSVEDEPTAYFMQSFYGYLKKHNKVDALQLAQLKTRKKYPHPSRWAAFQLTGASQ
ncbi:CHAT domain-containing protein [Vibrio sp. HA2012]|uniref:CHAT domain-containing protein n=1 Tax=Vibrio sp. HA2012 TaxID=1971595 RepID=UPI0012FE4A49|nr:CHAT domain-containing protein [Vibrio sp. HA2012]